MITDIPEEVFLSPEAFKSFMPIIQKMLQSSRYRQDIDEDVFQPSNEQNQEYVLNIVETILRPNSFIANSENLELLAKLSAEGKSCLLMPEHFSNFDYPGLFSLAKRNPKLSEAFKKLICMSASKLNTESKIVLAFSEAFNRIMIYPAREKEAHHDTINNEEEQKLNQLNQRALKKMFECKKQGHIVLLFPSGTRYRPNKPESRNALLQIASFIKQFDYFCLVGIAGNLLVVNPNNKMAQDIVREDSLVYLADTIQDSKEFLRNLHTQHPDVSPSEFKQIVAQDITNRLIDLHEKAEEVRAPLVKDTPPRYLGLFVPPHLVKDIPS